MTTSFKMVFLFKFGIFYSEKNLTRIWNWNDIVKSPWKNISPPYHHPTKSSKNLPPKYLNGPFCVVSTYIHPLFLYNLYNYQLYFKQLQGVIWDSYRPSILAFTAVHRKQCCLRQWVLLVDLQGLVPISTEPATWWHEDLECTHT